MKEKVARMVIAKGYEQVVDLDKCLVLKKRFGRHLKILVVYDDRVVVQDSVDYGCPVKIDELPIERAEQMLRGVV